MLVGTVSIEKSEALAALFKKHKIPHNVLNARYHEQEAYIIAQAGRPGAVTIATNMAGRGTDIQLGGNLEMRLQGRAGADRRSEPSARRAPPTIRAEIEAAREDRASRPAASSSSAASGTRAAASTTSCAAAPAARAIPAPRNSSSRSKTI